MTSSDPPILYMKITAARKTIDEFLVQPVPMCAAEMKEFLGGYTAFAPDSQKGGLANVIFNPKGQELGFPKNIMFPDFYGNVIFECPPAKKSKGPAKSKSNLVATASQVTPAPVKEKKTRERKVTIKKTEVKA